MHPSSTSDSNQMQPSLPSIHHLHPYLAPPVPSYPAAYATLEPPAPAAMQAEHPAANSDSEEQGPPKKKRRRQALSCTECKRRKIKCDRAQPCGPCSRRGEIAKCQWYIVDPPDKYVTRAEYDDLKSRFDMLENSLARLLPGFAATSQPPYMSAAPSNAPPIPAPAYHPQYASPDQQPVPSSSQQPPPRRPHLPLPPLPKPSPLSLAAITTPYSPHPDAAEPKNWPAQTLTTLLGERLRLSPDRPHPIPVPPQYRQRLQAHNE
ncbi:hypothetical protein NEOLEDRAFT_789239 [Neolentinus lepideus HHB14362 ss-1]|uniref:Zn(2)-C6 fungal-type domain-containing protein n=1 Tax=Neolentinus lepideus HHB14362 ss-1 TaxID=1314782 RepID=A0A165PJU0_9AGAM|nr:hypothetical protein NEOLEDRAFT_789239 [Neolentinus lepideus HHB14362 ss-1]